MRHSTETMGIAAGILLALLFAAAPASGAVLSANAGTGCAPVSSPLSVPIILNDIPTGLSGLNVSFAVSDPRTAQITGVTFPDWAMLHDMSMVPAPLVWIRGVDLQKKVNANDQNVPVATLAIQGYRDGSVTLTISATRVEDDSGKVYPVAPQTQTICFSGSGAPPAPAATPQAAGAASPAIPEGAESTRTTYSPLPAVLPVIGCILAAGAFCTIRRKRE